MCNSAIVVRVFQRAKTGAGVELSRMLVLRLLTPEFRTIAGQKSIRLDLPDQETGWLGTFDYINNLLQAYYAITCNQSVSTLTCQSRIAVLSVIHGHDNRPEKTNGCVVTNLGTALLAARPIHIPRYELRTLPNVCGICWKHMIFQFVAASPLG